MSGQIVFDKPTQQLIHTSQNMPLFMNTTKNIDITIMI